VTILFDFMGWNLQKELIEPKMETQLMRQVPTFFLTTSQLPRIILFLVSQGPDFHGTLPLLGTYEIKPWDIA
jgi:uncharacterized membrane protein